jgi:hypothetical protein
MTIENKNIVSSSSSTITEELPQSFPASNNLDSIELYLSDINESMFLPGSELVLAKKTILMRIKLIMTVPLRMQKVISFNLIFVIYVCEKKK